jgi:hypothetical protein
MHIRRFFAAVAVAAVMAVMGGASTAGATSGAHFFRKGTNATIGDNGGLIVNIDEAGVGQLAVDYDLSLTASADFGCVNGGQNHPKAANKETVSSTTVDEFSVLPENGRVQTTLVEPGPSAGSFSCPNGQTLVLASVTWTATLTDETNGVSITFGPLTRTFFQFGNN